MTHEEFKEKIFSKRPDTKALYDAINEADTILDCVNSIYDKASKAEREYISSLLSTSNLKILDRTSNERSDYVSQLSILICILNSLGYKIDINKV